MAKTLTNREFASTDVLFMRACDGISIPNTVRQASKWRMKKGRAWGFHKKRPRK